jgi:hypothetical protein
MKRQVTVVKTACGRELLYAEIDCSANGAVMLACRSAEFLAADDALGFHPVQSRDIRRLDACMD